MMKFVCSLLPAFLVGVLGGCSEGSRSIRNSVCDPSGDLLPVTSTLPKISPEQKALSGSSLYYLSSEFLVEKPREGGEKGTGSLLEQKDALTVVHAQATRTKEYAAQVRCANVTPSSDLRLTYTIPTEILPSDTGNLAASQVKLATVTLSFSPGYGWSLEFSDTEEETTFSSYLKSDSIYEVEEGVIEIRGTGDSDGTSSSGAFWVRLKQGEEPQFDEANATYKAK